MPEAASRKEKTRYQYDAHGRLVIKKNVNRNSTKFTYEGQDVILDDVDGTQTKYLNGLGIDNNLRAKMLN